MSFLLLVSPLELITLSALIRCEANADCEAGGEDDVG
jgi:hypothetical protein